MELTRKQEEGLRIAVERFRHGEKYTVIAGYAGAGKAQPVNTLIPTPTGWKHLGDLKIGSYVFDKAGKPTKILGIYPQGILDAYKITLADGRSTVAGAEHIWQIIDKHNRIREVTTQFLMDKGLKNSGGFKYALPNNAPVQYYPLKFNIDPYVIGVFLGDGCCLERQLTLSSATEEIPNMVAQLINGTARRISETNYNWTFLLPEPKINAYNSAYTQIVYQTQTFFQDFQKELCVGSAEKRIPACYKYCSIEQRLSLLQGLLDTDGTISAMDNGRYNIRYTSINKLLIEDVREVLQSLGYSSSIIIDKRTEKYANNECYTLNINIPNEEKYKLFRLKRKRDIGLQAREIHKYKDYNKISIVNIEQIPSCEMLCIYVDNDEHLYLTNDYIVTHNTTLIKFIIEALGIDPNEDVRYIAYTGKAANVLKNKGNKGAITAHKLLYYAKQMPNGKYRYSPRPKLEDSPLVVVVDEVSMLPKDMWELLCSHDVYIIAAGDPAQLPPIAKNGEDPNNHVLDHPHIFLDEIMRQAQDSEIIRFSMHIREGKPIYTYKPEGQQVRFLPLAEIGNGVCQWADQILCATHTTRRTLNDIVRAEKGFGPEPQIGDKVINLYNDWDTCSTDENPLTNGVIGTILTLDKDIIQYPDWFRSEPVDVLVGEISGDAENEVYYDIKYDYNELLSGTPQLTPKNEYFITKKLKGEIPHHFNFGYAITTWKAQGSSWPKVLLFDEPSWPRDKIEHQKYLYTGITRAENKLVVIQK